jgi:hypothetical protein
MWFGEAEREMRELAHRAHDHGQVDAQSSIVRARSRHAKYARTRVTWSSEQTTGGASGCGWLVLKQPFTQSTLPLAC